MRSWFVAIGLGQVRSCGVEFDGGRNSAPPEIEVGRARSVTVACWTEAKKRAGYERLMIWLVQ